MEGAAIEFALSINKIDHTPAAFLVTDFLNLGLFKSLLEPRFHQCRFMLYMHENQLTYPVSEKDSDIIQNRDKHYGFINYTSCLVADHVAFNSTYHRKSFIDALNKLSAHLPDKLDVQSILDKSSIIFSILNVDLFHPVRRQKSLPKTILWNHRWEYDKRPDIFLEAMVQLKNKGIKFKLILVGKMNKQVHAKYSAQLELLNSNIHHIGFATSKDDYYGLLRMCDLIVSTSIHDFFGISVLEGMYAGCRPILPFDLAYPELVPKEIKELVFYERSELVNNLVKCLSENWSIENQELIRLYIEDQFTWKQVESKYEKELGI